MSQEAAPATLAFEPAAGLTFKCLRKIPVTEGKSTESKKAGNLSKNAVITVIESFESNGGGLRVRCSRGWVTARTSNGSKNMEVFSSNADTENDINLLEDLSEMSANMAATKAEKGNESREYRKLCKDYQATASKRRPRTMTMALADTANGGTPGSGTRQHVRYYRGHQDQVLQGVHQWQILQCSSHNKV